MGERTTQIEPSGLKNMSSRWFASSRTPSTLATTEAELHAQGVAPLGVGDALLLTAYAAFFLLVSYSGSRGHMFWGDEVMGWLVMRSDSWHQLLARWYAGVDSSGIFFYVLGRPFLAVFGHKEIVLRFFSAVGIIASFAITWISARRFFSLLTVALALPIPFVINPVLMWQLSNARCYGVMMMSAALLCYAFLLTDYESLFPSAQGKALTFVAFLLLSGSHILGMFYAGCFLCGFVVRDLLVKRMRWSLYLCGLAGLGIVLFSYRNIRSTTASGKPSFWTLRPGMAQLPLSLFDLCKPVAALMLFVALCALTARVLRSRRSTHDEAIRPSRRPLYELLLTLAFIAVANFAVSRVTTSIFTDRYLLPLVLGDSLLLCWLFSGVGSYAPRRASRIGLAAFAPLLVAGIWFFFTHVLKRNFMYPLVDNTEQVLAGIPPGEPVVVTDIEEWVDLTHYANDARTFLTPIDWQVTLDPQSGLNGASGVHAMEYWKSQDLYGSQILYTPELLRASGAAFVVVSHEGETLWFQRRVAADPHYVVTELPGLPQWHLRVWQVKRISPLA